MILLDDIKSQTLPPRALTARKLLLTGPVGTGKTTVAKALAALAMGVEEALTLERHGFPDGQSSVADISSVFPFDFHHINGGDDGIDKVRDLAAASRQPPTDPRAKCRAFIIDEIHAVPDKAIQALLLPLERDWVNIWIACTSRPKGSLDAALRSRFAYHIDFGAADVVAVMKSLGRSDDEVARAARGCGGDLRLALGEGEVGEVITSDLVKRAQNGNVPCVLTVDARRLIALALRSPFAVQTAILDALVDYPEQHTQMCLTISQRNDVAAHQLVAAARKAKLL